MNPISADPESNLVLAAEDFDSTEFRKLHKFSANDERVISKLVAHGPVLLQGSRGSGKSALMREATERLAPEKKETALGIYVSLRYMPLLRSVGDEYQRILCELLIDKVDAAAERAGFSFSAAPSLTSVQRSLSELAESAGRRIVLLFDDAAHIGREASLADFFDVFRTLSNSSISCKASIYPGVTNFGTRFDVYNDATVVDVIRDENQPGFSSLFLDIIRARFAALPDKRFSSDLPREDFARFVGKSVLGNMRSFIFACNKISESNDKSIGLSTVNKAFIELTTDFYWPLLDEVKPKLGKYAEVVEPARTIAELLLQECGKEQNASVLIHRDIVARLSKALEILEYVGFFSKRESSKAMKSGGRGSRYALNLCMLLEHVTQSRLTSELYAKWKFSSDEPVQIHNKGSLLADISLPSLPKEEDPEILKDPIETLRKSKVYPYGLTDNLLGKLHEADIHTVKNLYDASEEVLDNMHYVGEYRVKLMKNLVSQAIWL